METRRRSRLGPAQDPVKPSTHRRGRLARPVAGPGQDGPDAHGYKAPSHRSAQRDARLPPWHQTATAADTLVPPPLPSTTTVRP